MAFGIAVIVVAVLLVVGFLHFSNAIHTDESQNPVVGSAYVGDWQDVTNPSSIIQIQPNGSASCQIVHGSSHYSINGGRATFDKKTNRLSIKLFFFGPSWHVDETPHETAAGFVMKLDGTTFLKSRGYPSPSGARVPGFRFKRE